MRNLNIYAILISVVVLASCGTSHDVVDGGLFQKRKYNKGYHFSKKSKVDFKSSDEQDVAIEFSSTITEESNPTSQKVDLVEEAIVTVSNSSNATLDINTIQDTPIKTSSFAKVEKTATSNISLVKSTVTNKKLSLSNFVANKIQAKQSGNISEVGSTLMDGMTVILIILAILLPPVAVLLYEGATSRFWIDLLLALIGWGLGWFLLGPHLAWVAGLAAIIYALLIVLGSI